MKNRVIFIFVLLMFIFSKASAITNGGPDNGGHPYVGLAVMQDASGNPLWRCSGTLIAPQLFITAGHCTDGAHGASIWFEEDIEAGIPDNGYPYSGAKSFSGTPYSHPSFNLATFFLHDLGVIVLDHPVVLGKYGMLPVQGQLDVLRSNRGEQDASFSAVGYGLQKSSPLDKFDEEYLVRLQATLYLVDITGTVGVPRDTSIMLTANVHTGGTCFGDSGGPIFADNSHIVVAVTSFSMNGNCVGVSGGYRLDQPDDLDWLYSEFGYLLVN